MEFTRFFTENSKNEILSYKSEEKLLDREKYYKAKRVYFYVI